MTSTARKNANLSLNKAGLTSFDHPLQPLLDKALQDSAGWDTFSLAAQAFPQVASYVKRNDDQVRDQVARRASLPQHHSIAAVESVLERVRHKVEPRTFAFRNQRRMSLLLGLWVSPRIVETSLLRRSDGTEISQVR